MIIYNGTWNILVSRSNKIILTVNIMSVLLCDSNCELWHTTLKEYGVDFISMPYYIKDEEYFYDLGEKTDFKQFFGMVRSGEMPKTQALNPENYKDIFTPYFERGEDVLYVSFSHAMSGTFNQLHTALNELKEIYPERKCTIFNTNSISLGAGIQVLAAARMKKAGATDEEIVKFLTDFTDKVAMYFVVDDLNHLKRGGRLGAFAAAFGTLLGIKPMLTVDAHGGLAVMEKLKGRKKALATLADKVINDIADKSFPVFVLDADCPEEGDRIAELIKEKLPDVEIIRQTIGPVIGSHCGPGTTGVIFVANERPIALEK